MAQAVDRGFAVTEDNVAAVVELCRRLDGVALAIELAAARVPLLGLTGLVASLDERLRLLTGGGPTAPLRQRTLRAALQWSHGLLDEAEQTVFRRLAVFAGSMALDSALRVAADGDASAAIAGRPGVDEWDSLDALAALVDRSLVAVVGQGDEAPRYRLLDTVHAFALERLQAAGDEDAMRQRHLEAMRLLFEPALAERYGGRVAVDEWQRRLEPDCANGLAAVSWAIAHDDPLGALAIAPALFHAMAAAAMRRQAAALWLAVEPLLDEPRLQAAAPALVGRAAGACSSFWADTEPKRSLARARQAVRALNETDDRIGRFLALARVTWPASRTGEKAVADEALRAMRELEDPAWPAIVRLYRAEAEYLALLNSGDFDGALRCTRRQADLERAAGWSNAFAAANAVHAALAAGRTAEAADEGRALVASLGDSRQSRVLAFVRLNLFAALLAEGALIEAREVAIEGWPQARPFGLRAWWADHLALLAALERRPRTAARLVGYADAAYGRTRSARKFNEARSMERALDRARLALGDEAVARYRYEGAGLDDAAVDTLALGAPGSCD
ncbi:MAG: hypothetical protein ABWZ78_02550 [Burkholderiaceae bacterium]